MICGTHSRKTYRWLIEIFLAIILAALRLPWLEADGGNRGFWVYGFFLADEGAYTSGGRLAYLTGKFLDPEMGEAYSFNVSWGMHLLSYLGYLLGGLSFGSIRLPVMLIAMIGWISAYRLVARITHPILAGLVTLVLSCNPVSLTYERVASTDVVVGSLMALVCLLVTKKRLLPTALGSAVFAFAVSVKLTALGLLPMVLLLVITRRHHTLKRLACFGSVFVLAYLLSLEWSDHRLHLVMTNPHDTAFNEASQASIMAIMSFKIDNMTRALSIFPRWPYSTQFGPILIWILALPIWHLSCHWHRTGRLLTRATAISIGVIVYAGLLAMQAAAALRYFLPLLYFTPALLVCSRSAFRKRKTWRWEQLLLLPGFLVILIIYWLPIHFSPETLETFRYQDEYVLPSAPVWKLTWPFWTISLLAMWPTIKWLFADRGGKGKWMMMSCISLSYIWLVLSNYTFFISNPSGPFVGDQVLIQFAMTSFFLIAFLDHGFRYWKVWYGYSALLFLIFALFNTHWRRGYAELAVPRHQFRDTARQLANGLPPNSMIIGVEASTLLRGTSFRLGICTFTYSVDRFFNQMDRLCKTNPDRPLYWLLEDTYDSQMRSHFRIVEDRLELHHRMTVQMPDTTSAELAPLRVYQVTRKSNE